MSARQYRRYRPDTVPTPLISLLEEAVARFASRLAAVHSLSDGTSRTIRSFAFGGKGKCEKLTSVEPALTVDEISPESHLVVYERFGVYRLQRRTRASSRFFTTLNTVQPYISPLLIVRKFLKSRGWHL